MPFFFSSPVYTQAVNNNRLTSQIFLSVHDFLQQRLNNIENGRNLSLESTSNPSLLMLNNDSNNTINNNDGLTGTMGLALPPNTRQPSPPEIDEQEIPQDVMDSFLEESWPDFSGEDGLNNLDVNHLFSQDQMANNDQMQFTYSTDVAPEEEQQQQMQGLPPTFTAVQEAMPMQQQQISMEDQQMFMQQQQMLMQQQQVQVQPPAPQPFQMPPCPAYPQPDQSNGPAYHPAVGWYFPVLKQSGLSTAAPSYAPMAVAPTPQPTIRQSTPAPTKPKGKKKYGPAAYLEQQARSRVDANAPTSNTIPQATASFSQPAQRLPFGAKAKKSNIVQTCICNDRESVKIKRPKNAFILYRSANSAKFYRELGSQNNQDVSRLAAQAWRSEPKEVQDQYYAMAAKEKERHKQMFPDYHYQPGQSQQNKFGSESCQCGAYRANMEALGYTTTFRGNRYEESGGESEVEEAYVPRLSSRRQQQVPAAQMVPQTPLEDPSVYGLQGVVSYVQNSNGKRNATQMAENQPAAKRRSSPRLANRSIANKESSEENVFQGQSDANDATIADSPARNTRSKSQSLSPPSQREPNIDFGGFDFNNPDFGFGATDTDPLFFDSMISPGNPFPPLADADANMEENINVADQRAPGYQDSPAMGTRSRRNSPPEQPTETSTLRRSTRSQIKRDENGWQVD